MSLQAWLLVGIITGTFGLATFVYGKKQQKLVPMLAGITLCIYPYFFNSLMLIVVIGLVLIVIPFLKIADF